MHQDVTKVASWGNYSYVKAKLQLRLDETIPGLGTSKQIIHSLASKMKEKQGKVVAVTLFQALEILLPPSQSKLFIIDLDE